MSRKIFKKKNDPESQRIIKQVEEEMEKEPFHLSLAIETIKARKRNNKIDDSRYPRYEALELDDGSSKKNTDIAETKILRMVLLRKLTANRDMYKEYLKEGKEDITYKEYLDSKVDKLLELEKKEQDKIKKARAEKEKYYRGGI